jgi:hypothetical protein
MWSVPDQSFAVAVFDLGRTPLNAGSEAPGHNSRTAF